MTELGPSVRDAVLDEVSSGRIDPNAGERVWKRSLTAACEVAAAEYGGPIWCETAVEYAWPYIRDGLGWIGGTVQDALGALIPSGLRAHAVTCWTCGIPQGQWASQRYAVEQSLTADERERLRFLLWRAGAPQPGEVPNPLPWDVWIWQAWPGSGDRYAYLRGDVDPNNPFAISLLGDWPDDASQGDLATFTTWATELLQRHRWQPWAAAIVAVKAQTAAAATGARTLANVYRATKRTEANAIDRQTRRRRLAAGIPMTAAGVSLATIGIWKPAWIASLARRAKFW